jgi:hypothetical protein
VHLDVTRPDDWETVAMNRVGPDRDRHPRRALLPIAVASVVDLWDARLHPRVNRLQQVRCFQADTAETVEREQAAVHTPKEPHVGPVASGTAGARSLRNG